MSAQPWVCPQEDRRKAWRQEQPQPNATCRVWTWKQTQKPRQDVFSWEWVLVYSGQIMQTFSLRENWSQPSAWGVGQFTGILHCQALHCFLVGVCFPVFLILLSFCVAHRPECPPQGPNPSWHMCWVCLNYLSSKRLKMVHRDECNVMTPALPYNCFSQAGSKDAGHLCNPRLQWGGASPLGYSQSFFNRFGWAPWQIVSGCLSLCLMLRD